MALPYPINATQTDAKSPVDDNLMDSIRLDLDYLDSLFSGGEYTFSFGLDGDLGYASAFKRAVDTVPLYKSYQPNTCRFGLRKSGLGGQLQIDIRKHANVNIPITGIEHQYDQITQSITNIAPAHATQSISLVTPAINTQSITYAKSAINVQSIILVPNGKVRYNLASAPDADWAIGDSVTFASCTNALNNGTFTIVEINQSGFPSVTVTNASAVAQTSPAGNAQLMLMSYNFTNPVNAQFVAGEQAVFATHTSANNNGTLTIYKVNEGGNNLWVKKSNGVTQAGVAGTASVGRWVYTYTLPVTTPDFTVAESAKMAGHTNALNNGNFRITAINSGGNNLVVYNPAGVAQGGAGGTANTNRWVYSQPVDPSTQFISGQYAQMENHTTSANNGKLLVVQVNRSALNNLVVYNEAGVTQAGIAGNTRHTRKLIKFSSDQSANFTTLSFVEIVDTPDFLYQKQDGRSPYSVLEINRGGGSNYNIVIDLFGGTSQSSPAGYVQTEMKSIFNAPPVLQNSLTGLSQNDWLATSTTNFISQTFPAGTVLGLYILQMPTGNPIDLKVTMHS